MSATAPVEDPHRSHRKSAAHRVITIRKVILVAKVRLDPVASSVATRNLRGRRPVEGEQGEMSLAMDDRHPIIVDSDADNVARCPAEWRGPNRMGQLWPASEVRLRAGWLLGVNILLCAILASIAIVIVRRGQTSSQSPSLGAFSFQQGRQ